MVEQGVEQRVLQPKEEEGQNSLKQGQLQAAERQKETEADWGSTTVNGLELGELQKESRRGDKAGEHQEVVGKRKKRRDRRVSQRSSL